MARTLTLTERDELLRGFEQSAFRLELQAAYAVPYEGDTLNRFVAGEPEPPTDVPALRAWFEQVATLVGQGKQIGRVRVHDEPPTTYQQWVRWIGAWNSQAGEALRYLTRDRAHEIGLLPAAGTDDWWLLDSSQLVVMRYNDHQQMVNAQLVTDPEPVQQACAWRDLATLHSTLDTRKVDPSAET